MIHYGKTPQGDLMIEVSADNVGQVHDMLYSSGLLPRRVFNGLQGYIEENFPEEIERYRRRMTAQIPVKAVDEREQGGACSGYAEREQVRRSSGKGGALC